MITAKSRVLSTSCALLLCACQPQQPSEETADQPATDTASLPTTAPAAEVLTPDGWKDLRIGMTRAEVVAAAGEDANPGAVGGAEPEQCDQFRPARAPEGMLVMIEQDRLTRISLSAPATVKTDGGFQVGDSASVIKAAYGAAALITPHKYVDAPAQYITIWMTRPPSPAARGIVYEIGADGRVQQIHAGSASIQYVEGCS